MTEYTTSSLAFREYMSSRERTAYWVQHHSPEETEFYSPSAPPSEFDGLPSPVSEVESVRSVPPKMVLRYSDGRPDVPIPHPESMNRRDGSGPRSRTPPHHSSYHRSRSGSHGSSPLSRSQHHHGHRDRSPPRVPEEIRILPSHSHQAPRTNSSSNHSRSRSLPRNAEIPPPQDAQIPFVPSATYSRGLPVFPAQSHSHGHGAPVQGQQVTFSPTQPTPWHNYGGRPPQGSHHPPAIVYAPSHHSRPHYAPPTVYSHPPQMGPNGVVYSHSAPVHSRHTPTPYPSTAAPLSHLASVHEERTRSRSQSRSRSTTLTGGTHMTAASSTSSLSDADSHHSGSTYYVLPTAGQKVHIIAPSPQQSIYTATSTTKSPTSPSYKKPFFQRLFSFAEKLSVSGSTKGSSNHGGGRRLQRRHSTGGTGRPRPPIPGH